MKRLIKTTIAAAATFVAAAAFAAPATAAENIHIIVVSHGQANDPFWSVVKNGVVAGAKDMGVAVDYRAPETFDMVAMSQLIDAAVNQKPSGLIVSIPDASALSPSIKKAVAAGIPVISMNSGSDVSKSLGALLHVGQDEETAGKAAGERLKEMGGKVALCVNQEVGNVALDLRCKGFTEGFGGKVTVLPVSNEPAEGRAKVKAALASNGDVGIWHETYLIRAGDYESVYNNMPAFGLGIAGRLVPAQGRKSSAKGRLGMADNDDQRPG